MIASVLTSVLIWPLFTDLGYKFYVGRSVMWTRELRWHVCVCVEAFGYVFILKVINEGKILE